MSYNAWDDEDYCSSGDEDRNDRVRRSRDRRTANNVDRVRDLVASPDAQNRGFVSALNTIRDDPNVQQQLQKIEEMWTVGGDKILADVMYTEVTLAIVQAAQAISSAGRRAEGESEEEFVARTSARSRTIGNFAWNDQNQQSGPPISNSSSTTVGANATDEAPGVDLSQLKIRARP